MNKLTRSTAALTAALLLAAAIPAQSLTTTFAGGNSGTTLWTNQFDITVLNPSGVLITSFDVNCENSRSGGIGTLFTLNVFVTAVGGTYVGNQTNQAMWTQVSTGTALSLAQGTPTPVDVADFVLAPGRYGIALQYIASAMAYTNGNGANQSYANADIQLDLGSSTTGLFAAPVYDPRVWNGTVYYNPATGLHASFSATPTSGPSPLQVQFADSSFSSDPGGVTSWAWDLDGNGTIDSTLQNPSFTYNSCGRYDVSLTVTDAAHPPSTRIERGFIEADPTQLVTADFTASTTGGAVPLAVQFTDTSTGGPQSWAWDFDGDRVIDSTLPNPSHTYAAGGSFTVSLTVTNACGPHTEMREDYIYVVANDECTGAMPVTFGSNGPFRNVGATTSTPAWTCGSGGNDVWFSFTAPCSAPVSIDTCGSLLDTTLEVFSGSCGNLSWIACNDNSCSTQSEITLSPVSAGATYYIRVGGARSLTGTFDLNLAVGGSGTFSTAPTGCGQATLDAGGSPNVGGGVTYAMNNVQGTPLLWLGTVQLSAPLCPAGCILGTTFDILFPVGTISGPIPCAPIFRGAVFYTQGADLNAPGGCMPPAVPLQMTLTDTVITTIG